MYSAIGLHLRVGDAVTAGKHDGRGIEVADYYTLKVRSDEGEVTIFMSPEDVKRTIKTLNDAVYGGVTV